MWSIANANIPSAIIFLDALYEHDKKLCKDLINTVSGTTHTALTLALAKGWYHREEDNPTYPMHSAIQKLITYGAEINHRQKENGNTALNYAYLHKDEEAIQYLIKNGTDITIKNEKGELCGMGSLSDRLYRLDCKPVSAEHVSVALEQGSQMDLWHQRLGHLNAQHLKELVERNLASGIKIPKA